MEAEDVSHSSEEYGPDSVLPNQHKRASKVLGSMQHLYTMAALSSQHLLGMTVLENQDPSVNVTELRHIRGRNLLFSRCSNSPGTLPESKVPSRLPTAFWSLGFFNNHPAFYSLALSQSPVSYPFTGGGTSSWCHQFSPLGGREKLLTGLNVKDHQSQHRKESSG